MPILLQRLHPRRVRALLFGHCVNYGMTFFDCHTHHPSADANVRSIRNVRLGVERPPAYGWYSVGVHPWDAHAVVLDTLDAALAARSPVAIGETGLDRLCGVAFDVQRTVFVHHVERSEQYALPLIIHCVRAVDDILALHRTLHPTMPWIMHGFNKGGNAVNRVVDAGIYVSFGGALLQPVTPACKAIQHVPDSLLLLETDDNPDVRIADVYLAAASLRHVSIESLCSTLQATFNTVFKP